MLVRMQNTSSDLNSRCLNDLNVVFPVESAFCMHSRFNLSVNQMCSWLILLYVILMQRCLMPLHSNVITPELNEALQREVCTTSHTITMKK